MFPKTKQDFLSSFTENTILTLVLAIREKELEKIEEERLRRTVEQEKLKMKFSRYENKEKLPPFQIKPTNLQEIKREVITAKEEYKPSTIPLQIQKPLEQKTEVFLKSTTVNNTQPIENKTIKPVQTKPIEIKPIKKQENIVKLKIPENQTPLQQNEINFGKILFLIRDPQVDYIECPAENQNIMIKKAGHTLKTQVILTKEEIISIITAFSEKTRIPLIEGLLNAKYDNLEMSAIVSNVISPSFIIKKDIVPQFYQNPQFLSRPRY
jgi:hypothetical protein